MKENLEEMSMDKLRAVLVGAVLCGGVVLLAPVSAAIAAPVAPVGKAATAIDVRTSVHYYGHHHHHHRCWWYHGHRHCRWW
jgi:hypothetical protein